jgi:hypothetical protein
MYFLKTSSLQRKKENLLYSIGCSLKFPVKVGVEESIVNASLVEKHKQGKTEVIFKQLIRSQSPLQRQL